jgi:sigma-B regulation protein RsbU (phosphoserine phosphatase)
VVTSNLQGGKFVTFFFAVIDSATRKLRYSNCGHNPPALVRADGSTHRLSEGGPAFARLMGGLGFSTGEIDLESGDRIVLFTDGVSEAMNGAAEQFGEDRLERLIVARRDETAIELEATVFKAVFDHADGELQDDLTLVVAAVN